MMYCSSEKGLFVVRRRPHVVNGGGFVVTDCNQKIVLKVDGCKTLGKKEELVLRNGDGEALLLILRKGMVEELRIYRKWKGYALDYEGSKKLVFGLREPNSCLPFLRKTKAIRISTMETKEWNFEIKGYFPAKACSLVDSEGSVVAEIGVKEWQEMMGSKDLYYVVVTPGIDQASVFGVIAILDYIYGESTRC